jgi:hypothetical protein
MISLEPGTSLDDPDMQEIVRQARERWESFERDRVRGEELARLHGDEEDEDFSVWDRDEETKQRDATTREGFS